MSHPPPPVASNELPPARSRRLSSSDFGEGDVLVGKYRIECVLGEGGMGIVLRATHIDLGCRVAIKVMRPELANDEASVSRFLIEAQAAACIRSEYVARVLDVGRLDNGAPFLVLEHLEGRDLSQVLVQRGHLASHVAVDFVLQACQALSEAHGAGIVHRDLKPENLFVASRADGTPIIKVLDFGISKRLTRESREAARTNPSELLGSPLYMAPEQMRGGVEVDARADIWSLGVVLYELCTGQSPFFGETIPSICARVIGIEPTPPSQLNDSIPERLEQIILRCLRKDREERPANVAQLAGELAEFGSADAAAYASSALRVLTNVRTEPTFEGERVTAVCPTLAVLGQGLRAPRRSRRVTPRVRLVGVALAAIAIVGGALSWRSGQAEASLSGSRAQLVKVEEAPATCLLPTTVAATPVTTAATSLPPVAPSSVAPSPSPRAAKTASLPGPRKAWDPKNFGGRL